MSKPSKRNKSLDKQSSVRPFSDTTNLMLLVDLDKGLSCEEVARLNADVLRRDYSHLLEHLISLDQSQEGEDIRKNIRGHRGDKYGYSRDNMTCNSYGELLQIIKDGGMKRAKA